MKVNAALVNDTLDKEIKKFLDKIENEFGGVTEADRRKHRLAVEQHLASIDINLTYIRKKLVQFLYTE